MRRIEVASNFIPYVLCFYEIETLKPREMAVTESIESRFVLKTGKLLVAPDAERGIQPWLFLADHNRDGNRRYRILSDAGKQSRPNPPRFLNRPFGRDLTRTLKGCLNLRIKSRSKRPYAIDRRVKVSI
jgi:hypothetical protein